jgi:hypothetical protein
MPMEIERAKIGRSSGNHVTVTKPASAPSSVNVLEGSTEESEILAEARPCYAVKTWRIRLKKGQTYVRLPLKSWNVPLKVARFCSIRVNIFSAQRSLTSNVTQILGAFNKTAIRGM